MSIEAMKQALEALENDQLDMVQNSEGHMVFRREVAITTLRTAIEEAEQKPVKKREWVGLTDEEITNLWSWSMTREAEFTASTQQHAFARAIEAKLKEKNA